MKHIIIFLTIVLAAIISCDTTDPKPPEEKPPGYQEDIPWPSLADSPWPRYHGNAQNNGRTYEIGPQAGVIEKIIEIEEGSIYAGIVVGADSCIYFATDNGYLFSMSKYGDLKWKIRLSNKEILSTPLVGADGTIYIGLFQEKKYIAVNNNGTIKWEYNLTEGINDLTTNMGLNGTLYFLDETSHLNALNQEGILLWKLHAPQFDGLCGLSFSPNGSTLYITSYHPALTAIDVNSHQILWEFDAYNATSSIVDASGNIYFIAKETNESFGVSSFMYCVSSNSETKWVYELRNWKWYAYQDPTIDREGNIYFASDTLYSLSYAGDLRWKKNFGNNYFRNPLICDGLGHIYSVLRDRNDGHIEMLSIDKSGDIIWQIPVFSVEQGLMEASGAIGYDNYWYVALDDEISKLFIIK